MNIGMGKAEAIASAALDKKVGETESVEDRMIPLAPLSEDHRVRIRKSFLSWLV